jgi:hypothetical protein
MTQLRPSPWLLCRDLWRWDRKAFGTWRLASILDSDAGFALIGNSVLWGSEQHIGVSDLHYLEVRFSVEGQVDGL